MAGREQRKKEYLERRFVQSALSIMYDFHALRSLSAGIRAATNCVTFALGRELSTYDSVPAIFSDAAVCCSAVVSAIVHPNSLTDCDHL